MSETPGGHPTTQNNVDPATLAELQEFLAQKAASAQQVAATVDASVPALNGTRPTDELNLDAVLATVDIAPRPVKLRGHTYMVRRDLTGPETTAFAKFVQDSNDKAALTLLVGEEDAAKLDSELAKMPRAQMIRAVQAIGMEAGVLTAGGQLGESQAP
jgi:hypothetical protein